MESHVDTGAIVREIEAAFADVSDAGVLPWGHSTVDSAEPIGPWRGLVEDEGWRGEDEIEPWSLLDAVGFRYYLPAAMVRTLKGSRGNALRWWLTLPLSGDEEIYLHRWKNLDSRQRAAIGKFLIQMTETRRRQGLRGEASQWEEAFESYWDS